MGLLYFIYPTGCFSELNFYFLNKELGQSFMLIMYYKIKKKIRETRYSKKIIQLEAKKKKILNHLAWIIGRFDPIDIQLSYDPNCDFDNHGCT